MLTRFLSALIVAFLLTTPASAAWEEYMYADLGIAKEFPLPPKMENVSYQTPIIGPQAVPAVIYAVEEDNIIYRMTVVDLRAPEFVAKSASIYAECIEMAEDEGIVIAKMPQRVEDGTEYRVYGQMTSVNLFGNKGRKQTNCFYTKGRLFKIETTVRTDHGEVNSAKAIRFTSALRFRIDGTSYCMP